MEYQFGDKLEKGDILHITYLPDPESFNHTGTLSELHGRLVFYDTWFDYYKNHNELYRIIKVKAALYFTHPPTEGDTITVDNMRAEFKKI